MAGFIEDLHVKGWRGVTGFAVELMIECHAELGFTMEAAGLKQWLSCHGQTHYGQEYKLEEHRVDCDDLKQPKY